MPPTIVSARVSGEVDRVGITAEWNRSARLHGSSAARVAEAAGDDVTKWVGGEWEGKERRGERVKEASMTVRQTGAEQRPAPGCCIRSAGLWRLIQLVVGSLSRPGSDLEPGRTSRPLCRLLQGCAASSSQPRLLVGRFTYAAFSIDRRCNCEVQLCAWHIGAATASCIATVAAILSALCILSASTCQSVNKNNHCSGDIDFVNDQCRSRSGKQWKCMEQAAKLIFYLANSAHFSSESKIIGSLPSVSYGN